MEAPQARIDSFKKSKRVKNPNKPSSTTTLKWPHPSDFHANPESLAEAGFYYDPSFDDPDNVTCYICEKELGGWEEDDDPFLIHWTKCGQTCCWAKLRCGMRLDIEQSGRYVFHDKTRHPTHKSMEKARLETFAAGKGWVHDKTKNHGASSKMMARAGFVFTPQHSGDDLATCLYCNTSLSGWDADDDPMEEHRKRQSKSDPCPFFSVPETAQGNKPASRAQSTRPPSKTQSKPASRSVSKSKHQDVLMPTKTFDGDEESDPGQPSNTTLSATKTPRKGRSTSGTAKTPRSKTRSSSRSGLNNVAEEEEEAPVEPPATIKKKARSRSKSVQPSGVADQTEEEGPRKPSRSKSHSRSKAKAQSEPEQEGEEAPRKSFRAKSKKSVAPVSAAPSVDEDEPPRKPLRSRTRAKPVESEPEQEDAPQVVTKPKPKHQRTASRSKAKAPAVQVDSESEPEPVASIAPKKKSSTKLLKTRVPGAREISNDDVVMESYVPPPSSPPPAPREPSPQTELEPLFVPKRAKKVPTPASSPDEPPKPVEKEKKKPGRPKAKPKPTVHTPPPKEGLKEPEVSVPSDVYGPLGPASINPTGQVPPGKEKPVTKPKTPGHAKQMKVVEVSSDEEEPEETELSKQTRKASISAQSSRLDSQDPTKAAAAGLPPAFVQLARPSEARSKPISAVGKRKPQLKYVVEPAQPQVSTAAPMEDVDVKMNAVESEHVSVTEPDGDGDTEMHTAPSTPPRSTASHQNRQLELQPATLPPRSSQEPLPPTIVLPDESAPLDLPKEPPLIPALSKLPFIPLPSLSDAELDMTVEEWIRYQIEVEFDKFRRDGERELQRFRKRAEEVRKVIESL
ncbi:hypothetical protein NLJ89_g2534 [Agrocybe chaxingu]|uniref:Protein bir1 n=1 Tax=Agrocybe chaxingu TaxID=84603 RepID=A0A9W8K471_9AGAR|nr:hypothetical protein NLJ89_g2534 [Agrocybe chaxingu]